MNSKSSLPYRPRIHWATLIIIIGSYLAAFVYLEYIVDHVPKPDVSEGISETLAFIILAITASVVAVEIPKQSTYRTTFTGILLLCLSMASDSLDEWYLLSSTASLLLESIARIFGFTILLFGILSAIKENSRLFFALRDAAQKDPLTQLFNRRHMHHQWQIEESRAHRSNKPLSLISVDVDRFKSVNDNFGHEVGDLVLVKIAEYLKGASRITDHVGRTGGEEFEIIQSNTSEAEAMVIAERFRNEISELSLTNLHPELTAVTVSIGIANYQDNEAYDDIRRRADKALYEAKNTGRNKVIAG